MDPAARPPETAGQAETADPRARDTVPRVPPAPFPPLAPLAGAAYRVALSPRHIVEHVSEGILRICGYPPGDFTSGRILWQDLIHPEDRPLADESVARAVAQAASYQALYRLRRADGAERWVCDQGHAIHDPEGPPRALEGYVTDVTEHRRAQEELAAAQRRLAAHLDRSPLATVEFDADFRVVRWSAAAERLFGWRADEMLGRAVFELRWVHQDDVDGVSRVMAHMLGSDPLPSPHRNRNYRKDGSVLWCDWYNSVLYDDGGRLDSIFCRVLDVTDRLRAEQALRESERRKDDFHAILAHELRNLLAPILIAADVLNLERVPEANARKARDLIARQVGHMVRFVEDLRDATRFTRGKLLLRLERLALGPILAQAREDALACAECAGHEIALSLPAEPLTADADPLRLGQVLLNLLTNACKYSPPGSPVDLALERDGTSAAISIVDRGMGILPDHLPLLFQMFSQVGEAAEAARAGFGIGLALSKGLVELHGGTIAVASDGPGTGSRFTVRLPLASAEGGPGSAALPESAGTLASQPPRA